MALLSDTDILALLSPSSQAEFKETTQQGGWVDSQSKLLIFPFRDELLTPVGYDLTIGDAYLSLLKKTKYKLGPNEQLVIQPGETVLVITQEYIGLPKNKTIGGIIQSKVSIVSLGLSHVSTTLDNDWEGHLLIAITNHQPYPVTLRKGQPFCTAMFFLSKNPATRSCGKPPGRRDITEERLDYWLKEARQAETTLAKRILPALVPLSIVVLFSVVGLWIFGPTEGFAGSVAFGAAVATVVQAIRSKAG